MNRERSLAERVAAIEGVRVTGTYYRHAAPNRDALAGGTGGRWGDTFPVVYVGRPEGSCVEEAYRHLVDDAGVPAHLVRPRVLYTYRVEVDSVLDLRERAALDAVGLTEADLESGVGDYSACQRVAAVAHQLEYHAILAPAATGQGETLALFRERVSLKELPVVVDETRWEKLPQRPGTARLSLVRPS